MGQTIKQGKASATFDQDIDQLFTGLLDTVAPNARLIMDESLQTIETEAIQQWPRRKPKLIRGEGGRIIESKDESKKSYRQFVRGFRVDADGKLVVYLRNTAPYSYMIKYGVDSENYRRQDIVQPQGRNVANETLIKPIRKTANAVVRALAADLFTRV